MSDLLSPEVEHVISDALSRGDYSSRKALLETCVLEYLAAKGNLAARLELCDQAIDDYEAGRGVEWDPQDLMRRVRARIDSQRKRC